MWSVRFVMMTLKSCASFHVMIKDDLLPICLFNLFLGVDNYSYKPSHTLFDIFRVPDYNWFSSTFHSLSRHINKMHIVSWRLIDKMGINPEGSTARATFAEYIKNLFKNLTNRFEICFFNLIRYKTFPGNKILIIFTGKSIVFTFNALNVHKKTLI